MEDMYHYRRSLDSRQREVSEEFEAHADTLEKVAEIRHEDCKNIWRLTEPLNSEMATKMSTSITDFESVCRDISESIHTISTREGEVFPENSREYLEQEIKREVYREAMKKWRKNHVSIRDYGNDVSKVEFDRMGTTEFVIYKLGIRDLSNDLSNLDENDECLRASLILGEIQRERRRLVHSLVTSPMQLGKEIGSTVLISMASLGASWGVIAGASMTGASVATCGVKNWRKAGLLSGPEKDCKKIIAKNVADGNKSHLQDCFARAGIKKSPEDVIQEVIFEDVPEGTVALSPYG